MSRRDGRAGPTCQCQHQEASEPLAVLRALRLYLEPGRWTLGAGEPRVGGYDQRAVPASGMHVSVPNPELNFAKSLPSLLLQPLRGAHLCYVYTGAVALL